MSNTAFFKRYAFDPVAYPRTWSAALVRMSTFEAWGGLSDRALVSDEDLLRMDMVGGVPGYLARQQRCFRGLSTCDERAYFEGQGDFPPMYKDDLPLKEEIWYEFRAPPAQILRDLTR